jgi:hypothetical protein
VEWVRLGFREARFKALSHQIFTQNGCLSLWVGRTWIQRCLIQSTLIPDFA